MEAVTTRARMPAVPAWLESAWVTAAFALVVAVVTWDPQQIIPAPGLDASWILGLNLAAAEGLDHGTEVVFTYGPLGFLEVPSVAESAPAVISGIYLLATRAALAATLLWAARRTMVWPAAALLAFCVMAIAPRATASVPMALAVVWALVALHEPAPPWTRRLLVVGGGALAAVEVLVKLNTGVTILLVVAIATIALPGRRLRNLGLLAGVFAVAVTALWLAAGQSAGNAGDYLRSAFLVVSGYSEAMQLEAPEVGWDRLAALLAGAATIGAVVWASAGLAVPRRAAMVAITVLVCFSLWKFGFVRHDGGHAGAYFEGLLVIWAALAWHGRARVVPFAATAAIAALLFPAAGASADFTIRPGQAVEQLEALLVPGERERVRDDARAAMAATYAVDPRILARAAGEPLDVRPWEIGLAWAYGLDYQPLPVLQDYQAYDPALDQLNADALAGGDAPRYVLRHLGYGDSGAFGLDGRFSSFDSPRATLELLCRYRPVLATDAHVLLERAPASRCGASRELGIVEADYGEQVDVPRAKPHEAVTMTVDGAAAAGLERVRSFAERAAQRVVVLDDARFVFPARNASGPLLVRVPPTADFPEPLAVAPNASQVAVETEGGFAAPDGPLRLEFRATAIEAAR